MPPLPCLIKTVSSDCNLACSYCYYGKSPRDRYAHRQVSSAMLEKFMPQYMEYIKDSHQASLSWQGGEPTLAGLNFFYHVVELEAQCALPGTIISNALQTNGTLLNDDWGRFLKTYNFLVGVSLDGPEEINDVVRKGVAGNGSFRRVMKGIEALQRNRVDFNILTVLGPHNVGRVRELMRFFRGEGFHYLQFMPAMAFQAIQPLKSPSYLITPEKYAEFLVALFDEWYGNGTPTVSVRIFDNFLESYLGVQNELCVHSRSCNSGIVVEHNGDVYPCDFYIHPRWKLGNIFERPLGEIVESPRRRKFIEQKQPLGAQCLECEWRSICNGGCARNRFVLGDGSLGTEYFCQSYKRFFSYADSRMRALSARLINGRFKTVGGDHRVADMGVHVAGRT